MEKEKSDLLKEMVNEMSKNPLVKKQMEDIEIKSKKFTNIHRDFIGEELELLKEFIEKNNFTKQEILFLITNFIAEMCSGSKTMAFSSILIPVAFVDGEIKKASNGSLIFAKNIKKTIENSLYCFVEDLVSKVKEFLKEE